MSKIKFIIAVGLITFLIPTLLPFSQKGYFEYRLFQTEVFFEGLSYFIDNQYATVIKPFNDDEKIKVLVPFHKQEHNLTCETAALRMALNYRDIDVTEEDLLEQLYFDTKDPKTPDNIWGDPDNGFVGNIDGSVFFGTGYGVYDEPIMDLALQYKEASILKKVGLSDVLKLTEDGHPVIVWGIIANDKPIFWKTKDGKDIKAFAGEHARVIMGYTGDILNPKKIILMDPIFGKIRMDIGKFLADWKIMDNKAVLIF